MQTAAGSETNIIPGSDEDLAIQIIARFAAASGGRNGRWKEPLKNSFVDGALWMKKRLSSYPSPDAKDGEIKKLKDIIKQMTADFAEKLQQGK